MSAGSRRPRNSDRHTAAMLACALVLGSASCVDSLLLPDQPSDDPQANFDALWTEVDRHYAFFEEKGIDWDALYQDYRPRVTATSTDRELFYVMAELLDHLHDGHVNLWTPVGNYAYTAWYEGYPENFDEQLALAQLGSQHRTRSRQIYYGRLTVDIGYIHVPAFDPAWSGDMDEALDALSGIRALVLDVRSNGGGSDSALPDIIGRFVDRKRVYARYQYRDGPGHDDFSDFVDGTVSPRGEHFDGPVAVLTNRRCFSTTEDFLMAARSVPSMFTVGGVTGGGQGNPILRELPNGWMFRVSRWRVFYPDGTPLPDGVGQEPDYPVELDEADRARNVDTIIARAVALLEERLTGS